MAMYLHVVSGPYALLFHADDVREVLDLRHGSKHLAGELAAGHRSWREHMLPEVKLRALFSLPEQDAEAALVYASTTAEPTCVIEVDRISGLVHLTDDAFRPMPPVSPAARQVFDAVHTESRTGKNLLRLRRGLELPGLAGHLSEQTDILDR